MSDRLFPLDDVPEVPLFREPRRSRGAQVMDARLDNDYPPEWSKCITCGGGGKVEAPLPDPLPPGGIYLWIDGVYRVDCPDCLGMGSVKARVRLESGHRCVRCQHPFMTKGDAKMLGVEPSPGHWSPCDEKCTHGGVLRYKIVSHGKWYEAETLPLSYGLDRIAQTAGELIELSPGIPGLADAVEAEWRVLTVHHCNGQKDCLAWWNLLALCQRCHLQIQAKVVLERVYPHEHSSWFKPFVSGYYAHVYLGLDLTREEVTERMDELLALERAA